MEFVNCNLCGSDQYHKRFSKSDQSFFNGQELSVVSCLKCGLQYLNPRPKPIEMAAVYSTNYKYCDVSSEKSPRPRTGIKKIQKSISKTLNRWIMEDYYGYPRKTPEGIFAYFRKWVLLPEMINQRLRRKDIFPYQGEGKLLDVGCGPGANIARFLEYGWDAYGVDVSEIAVVHARKRLGNRIFHGDLFSQEFNSGSFDLILFRHSLEHVHDPVGILKEAHRILRDGGLLVLLLPNIGSWEAKLFSKWWVALELPWHLYHFDRPSLRAVLEKSGFQCVRIRTSLGSGTFMTSLELIMKEKWGKTVFMKGLIDRCVARSFCRIAGYLGQGAEMEVYARKADQDGHR
jgi:SAM-dependent methyltransferase